MREKKKISKYAVFIIVLLILVSLFFMNFLKGNRHAPSESGEIAANLSAISTFDYSKVTTIEQKIRKLEITEAKSTFDITKRLSPAQYKKIFSTSIVLGDSITEGITAYGYLGEDQVFSKIGASIISGDDLFETAAKTYPGFAYMSFGMNDMGNYSGNADMFIDKYTKLITEFKKTSPDTRILINGILPPAQSAIDKNPIIGNYKEFNNALRGMCKSLHLTYIDNSYIIEEHPEFYAGDGIHVSSEFYPLWLNNMIMKAGL